MDLTLFFEDSISRVTQNSSACGPMYYEIDRVSYGAFPSFVKIQENELVLSCDQSMDLYGEMFIRVTARLKNFPVIKTK